MAPAIPTTDGLAAEHAHRSGEFFAAGTVPAGPVTRDARGRHLSRPGDNRRPAGGAGHRR